MHIIIQQIFKFIKATFRGCGLIILQLIPWFVIDYSCSLRIHRFYYQSHRPLWVDPYDFFFSNVSFTFALNLCIVFYTMLFSWYFAFVNKKYQLKFLVIPYFIYAISLYLTVVSEHNWNFKIVSLDVFLRTGLLMPLYGLLIWSIVRMIKLIIFHSKSIFCRKHN